MPQSKLASLVEVTANVGSGFLLAMFIWQFVVPMYYPHLEPSLQENITMTTVFTLASICRGLIWRRLFTNGLYETVTRLFK